MSSRKCDPSIVTDTAIAALVRCEGDPRAVIEILGLSPAELARLANDPDLSAEARDELAPLVAVASGDRAPALI